MLKKANWSRNPLKSTHRWNYMNYCDVFIIKLYSHPLIVEILLLQLWSGLFLDSVIFLHLRNSTNTQQNKQNRENILKALFFIEKTKCQFQWGYPAAWPPAMTDNRGTWNSEAMRAHLARNYVNQYFFILHSSHHDIYIEFLPHPLEVCYCAHTQSVVPSWD